MLKGPALRRLHFGAFSSAGGHLPVFLGGCVFNWAAVPSVRRAGIQRAIAISSLRLGE
jgi:hypothetical protein